MPIMTAAYPVAAIASGECRHCYGHQSRLDVQDLRYLGGRPGFSAVLVDGEGTVLGAVRSRPTAISRRSLDKSPMLVSRRRQGDRFGRGDRIRFHSSPPTARKRAVTSTHIPGTGSRLIVSVDGQGLLRAPTARFGTAYLQLGFVCLFVLLGALIAAGLIIQPIGVMVAMAKRFGEGRLVGARGAQTVPAEFVPLAQAFNAMAAHS